MDVQTQILKYLTAVQRGIQPGIKAEFQVILKKTTPGRVIRQGLVGIWWPKFKIGRFYFIFLCWYSLWSKSF